MFFRTSYFCKCPVVLPHGAVCQSAVRYCGISWSYSSTFRKTLYEFDDIDNLFLKTPKLEQILAKRICCELFTPSEVERGTSASKSKCV